MESEKFSLYNIIPQQQRRLPPPHLTALQQQQLLLMVHQLAFILAKMMITNKPAMVKPRQPISVDVSGQSKVNNFDQLPFLTGHRRDAGKIFQAIFIINIHEQKY